MCKYFLYYWGWFEFSKYLDTWKHIACWIFISLRSILYSLNWLYLECLHASVYGSHSVKFAYIERENIFLHGYPQLLFFFLVFPHLLNFFQNCFFQNLCCFPYFYRGRKLFLKSMLFIRGVASIFYWAYVLCSLNSLFSLILCCVCLLATLC